MKIDSALGINTSGLWGILVAGNPIPVLRDSLPVALGRAHELSGQGVAVTALIEIGTDNRLEPGQIKNLWREQGLYLPSP